MANKIKKVLTSQGLFHQQQKQLKIVFLSHQYKKRKRYRLTPENFKLLADDFLQTIDTNLKEDLTNTKKVKGI